MVGTRFFLTRTQACAWILLASSHLTSAYAQSQAQECGIEQIAISIQGEKAELCVSSPMGFARVEALASALEECGHKQIELSVYNPTPLGTSSTEAILISIAGNSARIYPLIKMSTLRKIVESLKETGVESVSLVQGSALIDLETKTWLVKQQIKPTN